MPFSIVVLQVILTVISTEIDKKAIHEGLISGAFTLRDPEKGYRTFRHVSSHPNHFVMRIRIRKVVDKFMCFLLTGVYQCDPN